MENKLKRFMSLTLALLMVFSMMPQISLGVKAASETKTVYFQNNWLWTDVRCYYWNDGTSSSWPGDAMTFVENDGTYDIYKAEIPANAYIIFNGIKNDNSGSRDQTPDMTSWDACAVYYMYWNNGNTVKTDSKKHSYTSVVTAPDCVNAGYTTYTCSSCGDSYTEAGEAATGHTYEKGGETCDNCDEPNPNYVAPVTPAAPTLTEAQLNDTILITWKHTAADGAASTNGTYFTRGEIVKSEDGVYTCTLTMTQKTLNSQAQGYVTTFDEVHSTHAHALPTDFPTEGGLSFTLTWDAANSEWTYEGVTYTLTCTEKAPGSGTLGTSYISESDDRATIYGEVTGMTNAKESIVVKLYSGETLLATTTLANLDYLSSETLGVNIVISGRASSSWNTVWEEGHPVASHCPDKAVLYIDGVKQNTANVTLGTIDDLGEPYVWAEIEGVSPVIYKVTTYEELVAALENDNAHVLMLNDITGTATQSSGYGKAGIVLNAGDVLDGNGYTLTINGANATWDCAIAMKGGEVKNLTIAGAMRGVFMPGANGDVVIDNCVFKDVIYTFNSDAGSKDYSVTIKNTTLNGWTSFSDVHGSVTFDSCSFGEGSGYAFCRPYQATTFTNCSFAEGFKLDTTQTADNTLAFNSCTYAGEAISADNSAMFYNGGSVMINGVATDVTNYPAYIGGTGYETVAAALAAAVDGDEVVINEAGTYSVPTGKDITVTGTVEGVEFTNIGAYNMGSANVTFNNVTFTYATTSSYMGLQHAGNLVYNNCTINGQVFLYGASEIFNDCTFNTTDAENYNVWTYGAKVVNFNGCTFNCAGKSVLVYNEGANHGSTVNVTECEFIAPAPVAGKAAIEIDTSLNTNGSSKVVIDDKTTVTGFGTGSVSGNSLWNDKKNQTNITVVVDGVEVWPNWIAQVGETKYTSLQAAIDAAKTGETVTLLKDCAENVTVTQAPDYKITIDGAGKTYTGSITVNGKSQAYETTALTIKNVKFDATNISKDASINLGGSNNTRYTNHVTVEDCSFTGTDNAKVGIKNYTGGCKNLTVTGCTATGLHSLIQVKGVDGITVTNVTVENCKNGISVGPSTNVVIENANITAEGYGIRADGTAAYNVTVKNSTISADLPIVVRNNTAEGYNLTLEGTNSLAASNENGYQVIFTSGDDGTYEVPAVEFNLTGAEGLKVFPAYVAQIGDVKYGTVTEAVEAAKPSDTIELIADAEEASVILLDGIDLDLYGHTLTVTGYIAAYDGNNIIDTDGNGLLKITKGKIMIQDDNTYLPIWDDTNKGYVFANCENFKEQTADIDNGEKYIFLPELAVSDYELIAKGIEVSGVTLKVEVSWARTDGTLGTATFTYTDALIKAFYESYGAKEEGEYGSAFTLILTGTEGKTLSYKVYFVSDTGVTYECN